MNLDDALEGFTLALKFKLQEEQGERLHRAGVEQFTHGQRQAIYAGLAAFERWRKDQEARIEGHICGEKYGEEGCPDAAVIQCLSCGEFFCEDCWVDHLHMSIEEVKLVT